jgi:hypothetical protein
MRVPEAGQRHQFITAGLTLPLLVLVILAGEVALQVSGFVLIFPLPVTS